MFLVGARIVMNIELTIEDIAMHNSTSKPFILINKVNGRKKGTRVSFSPSKPEIGKLKKAPSSANYRMGLRDQGRAEEGLVVVVGWPNSASCL